MKESELFIIKKAKKNKNTEVDKKCEPNKKYLINQKE